MYRVLRGEMVKKGITISKLARQLNVTEKTLRNKINGKTEFLWSEVLEIRKIVSPDVSLEELFKFESNAA